MKRLLTVLLFAIPSMSYAQKGGITFSNANNWEALIKEAKTAHKAIFIDVMATWCGPCKQMDKDVYSNNEIGSYMDANFISIKLQMDSTGHDNDQVIQWRKDAKSIAAAYQINAFPSFLFFDENGNLIHKDLAFKSVHGFLALAKRATDPTQNYSGLQNTFENGKLNQNQSLELMDLQKKFKEDSFVLLVAKDYKSHYIDHSDPDSILGPHLIDFLDQYSSLFSFKDPLIRHLYSHQQKADKALKNPGYAKRYTDYIISRDMITTKIWPNGKSIPGTPNWTKIQTSIAKQYPSTNAEKLVLNAKVRWYREKRDWDAVVKHEIKLVDINGIDTSVMGLAMANNLVFGTIFKYGTQKPDLEKGISYMQIILKNTPEDYFAMDTYANILYKAGHKDRAIQQENIALEKAREKKDVGSIQLYEETITKMQQNLPTWQ